MEKAKHHHRAGCDVRRRKKNPLRYTRFSISPHISLVVATTPKNTFLDFCCSELGMFFWDFGGGVGRRLLYVMWYGMVTMGTKVGGYFRRRIVEVFWDSV